MNTTKRHDAIFSEPGSVAHRLLYAVLLGGVFLLILGAERLFFGAIQPVFSLGVLFLLAGVGLVSFRIGMKVEGGGNDSFIRKENYRQALLQSSKDIVSLADRQTLSEKVVRTLTQIFNVQSVAFFLLDEVKAVYQLRVSIGWDKDFKHISLPLDDPLIRRISRQPRILTEEDLEVFPIEENKTVLLREMQLLTAKIIVPLMLRERLVGLFSLGPKIAGGNFTQADLELLSILGNQASVALENARLYENLKNSQSIIRRADRLSSLGMLTAGLAHEIRNPLVAIRTFTQLLPERYKDREFREEFQAIALREVDRICGLVNDLLSFARPSTPNVSLESINDIVDSIARILETEAKERGIQIERRLAPDLPRIFIDQEQIKQVCMNLILNAIQSIEGDGLVEVSTRLFTKSGSEQFVQIGVRDSGVGIPEKDLENIFNPFFTTKKEGSGLGLSISHQIVQEHGGYIVVESEIGKGTAFFINLPVKHVSQQGTGAHSQVHEDGFGS